MKRFVVCLTALLCLAVARAEPVPVTKPVAVMTVSRCAKLIALIFVAEDGTLHPLDVSHMTLGQVLRLLAPFPRDPAHALGVIVPCDDPQV